MDCYTIGGGEALLVRIYIKKLDILMEKQHQKTNQTIGTKAGLKG